MWIKIFFNALYDTLISLAGVMGWTWGFLYGLIIGWA